MKHPHLYPKNILPAILFLLFALTVKSGYTQNEKGKFNVLFIILDDMNDKCSVLNHPEVLTPNLERLASHGMVFTNAYCQFSLCNPSRTSVLTGWRPDKTQVFNNQTSPRSKIGYTVRFMPEYFHDNGYRTERFGKIMHSTFQSECSWDYAFPASNVASKNSDNDNNAIPGQWWVTTTKDSLKPDGKDCTKLDSTLRVKRDQPFFFGLGLEGTHSPFTPGITYWNKYGDNAYKELMKLDSAGTTKKLMGNGSGNIALPQTPANDLADIPELEIQGGGMLREPDDEWQRSIHAYYGEVTEMDTQLGRVLDVMDEQHLWNNTVVVFISDHGQFLGEHEGMWYKNRLLNEALHVPLIICVPGMPAGRCDKLVESVDIYPTLTDLCGIKRPKDYQGTSLVPLLVNPNMEWKPAVFSQVTRGTSFQLRSVYTDKYHYMKLGTSYELYDRIKDPYEYTNLALNTSYAAVMASMQAYLDSGWKKSYPPTKDSIMYFFDGDKDGYGTLSKYKFGDSIVPASYCMNVLDCDDSNSNTYPGAPEICDGVDNNCDGIIDLQANISPTGIRSICKGESAILKSTGDSCNHYKWFKNGILISNATSKSLVVTDSGSYTICAYNDLGDSIISNAVSVEVHSNPPGTVTVSANTNICKGAVLLTAPYGYGLLTYQWMKGASNIVGATSQSYAPSSAGGYKVKVTNKFGCTSTSATTTVINNCSFASNPGIHYLYPNPAGNILYVQFNASKSSDILIVLKNLEGTVFKKYNYNVVKGENTISIKVNDLVPGSYLIETFDGSVTTNKKFVISR